MTRTLWASVVVALVAAAGLHGQVPIPELHEEWATEGWGSFDFGLIVDVAPSSDGGLLVLDDIGYGFALLDAEGRHVASLMAKGRGPSEFEAPLAIQQDADGRVVVLDASHGTLRWFRREGDGFDLDESWRPPMNLRDFCLLGTGMAVLGVDPINDPAHVVHVLGPDRTIRSSSRVPAEEAEVPLLALSDGRLACIEDAGMILFLPDVLGAVFAFSESGRFLWGTSLPGYAQMGIEGGAGWIRYTPGDEGRTDMGAAVTAFGSVGVVQYARVEEGSPRADEAAEVTTIYLDLRDGRVVGTSTDTPRIVAVVGDTRLFGYRNWPLPAATSYRVVSR